MSSTVHGPSGRLTPRRKLPTTHNATRLAQEDDRLILSLNSIIGTTTTNANAFDSESGKDLFAYCAGPAAVISDVDVNLNVTQRLFRAAPNASPLNSAPSYYNPSTPPGTPSRNRHGSPFKDLGRPNPLATPLDYTPDSPGNSKSQNRVKEATCLSISPQGDYLAVGETGYNPRVLLFSLKSDAPADIPSSILTDHSFGVQSVALSYDSRWLCSLGNSYDGFLLLYSVNLKTGAAKLYSSNRCSNVHNIVWMGNSVISIGTRHVKLWRIERASSPAKGRLAAECAVPATAGSRSPRTFQGRNCILGSLIDATFTCAVALSDRKAIICTSEGDVCLLDDSNKAKRLEKVFQLPFNIYCVHFDQGKNLVWFGGKDSQVASSKIGNLNSLPMSAMPSDAALNSSRQRSSRILALGSVRNCLVTVDSERVIQLRRIEFEQGGPALLTTSKTLPAHESAVLGACSLAHWHPRVGSDFLTYSARGTLLLWNFDGTSNGRIDIAIDQASNSHDGDRNELKVVVASDSEQMLYAGDRIGMLRVVDPSGLTAGHIQAHCGDMSGISTIKLQGRNLVASCGRDRTLQLFHHTSGKLALLQTLDDHAAAVTDLAFLDSGSSLVSISSDRTILMRRAAYGAYPSVAYLPMKAIVLKASPVSFAAVPSQPNIIIVSTMDRQIQRFDISSGRLLYSFKALEPANNDSVLASSLQVANVEHGHEALHVILAVSSTDKSIRLHDYDTGSLLAREHGQTAVSSVKLIKHVAGDLWTYNLISCGLDGTVIVYNLSTQPLTQRYSSPSESPVRMESPLKFTPSSSQPLRKTLTKSEIADFQKALHNSTGDNIDSIERPSSSRVRKRTAGSRVVNHPGVNSIGGGFTNYMSKSSPSQPKTSQDQSPHPPHVKSTIKGTRVKTRPSLDQRHRSKSATNLGVFDASAEQICGSLRAFRNRVTSSVGEKLKPAIAEELHHELELTLHAMRNGTGEKFLVAGEALSRELLDTYLAKVVDDRLAMAQGVQATIAKENAWPRALSNHHIEATSTTGE
ncbi:MAG: hypothetical protein Q9163_004004 [Psora crenata]